MGTSGDDEHQKRISAAKVLQRYTGFRWFSGALFTDAAGEGAWYVALGWVASHAPNPITTGLILASGAVPSAMLTLLGGKLADTKGSRRMATVTLAARLAILVIWALFASTSTTGLIAAAIVAILNGAISGFHEPAMGVFATELVAYDGKSAALNFERAMEWVAVTVGASAAGVLIGSEGTSPAAWLAVAFLVCACVLIRPAVRAPSIRQPQPSAVTSADNVPPEKIVISDAFRFIKSHQILRLTMPTQVVTNFVTAAVVLAVLPLKTHALGWNAETYGGTFGAYGLGLAAGTVIAFAVTARDGWFPARCGMVCCVVACGAATAVGFTDSISGSVVCFALIGLASGPTGPTLSGLIREVTPDDIIGRVFSVLMLGTSGIAPASSFLIGLVTQVTSANHAANWFGAVGLVVSLISTIVFFRVTAISASTQPAS